MWEQGMKTTSPTVESVAATISHQKEGHSFVGLWAQNQINRKMSMDPICLGLRVFLSRGLFSRI